MVILKKIKGSTLMETLVATVLIVIVFMLASMILNTMFSSSIKNNTRSIEAKLSELQYLELNNQLEIPYQDTYDNWNISVGKYQENSKTIVEFEASNKETRKTIVLKQHDTKQ